MGIMLVADISMTKCWKRGLRIAKIHALEPEGTDARRRWLNRPTLTRDNAALLLQVLKGLFIFETYFVDEIGIDDDALPQRDGPGFRVGLRIVDSDLDFEMAEVGAAHLLAHFG